MTGASDPPGHLKRKMQPLLSVWLFVIAAVLLRGQAASTNESEAVTSQVAAVSQAAMVGAATSQVATVSQDSKALCAFFSAVDSPSQSRLKNWTCSTALNAPYYAPCNNITGRAWLGVSCGNGQVTSLKLGSVGLKAKTIPSALFSLSYLTYLDLQRNYLAGTLPSQIWLLTGLTYINLAINNLRGSLPESTLGKFSNLVYFRLDSNKFAGSIPTSLPGKLQYFHLGGNSLDGTIPASLFKLPLTLFSIDTNRISGTMPSQVNSMKNLTLLGLGKNLLTGTLGKVWNMPLVTYLNLNANNFVGTLPPQLGLLTKLKFFAANENAFSGNVPAQFGNLTNLQFLDLGRNNLNGTLSPQIGGMTALTFLQLSSQDWDTQLDRIRPAGGLRGSIPPEIGKLTALQELYLNGNKLGGSIPTQIGQLTGLSYLFISTNQLTGRVPSELDKLTALVDLEMYSNMLTGPLPSTIGDLTSLTNLQFNNNKLTGSLPSSLGNLLLLQILTGDTNSLVGTLPTTLGQLGALTYFVLNNNKLVGPLPVQVAGLSSLSYLRLSYNSFTGVLPTQLGQLTNLVQLDLKTNSLRGSIPTQLGQLNALTFLDLDTNQLSGAIPSELGRLKKLIVMDLSVNKLAGVIPTELGLMTKMLYLLLNTNSLGGTIPAQLASSTGMHVLWLYDNSLVGTIPESFCSFQTSIDLQMQLQSRTGLSCYPQCLKAPTYTSVINDQSNNLVPCRASYTTDGNALWDLYRSRRSGASRSVAPSSTKTKLTNWCGNKTADGGNNYVVSPCLWTGVHCSVVEGVSRVANVSLHNVSLVGARLPTSFGFLDALVSLDLSSTGLVGSIPAEMGLMTSLMDLNLSSNSLTGPLPYSFCNLNTSIEVDVMSNPGLSCYPGCFKQSSNGVSSSSNFTKDASLGICHTPTSRPTSAAKLLIVVCKLSGLYLINFDAKTQKALIAAFATTIGLSPQNIKLSLAETGTNTTTVAASLRRKLAAAVIATFSVAVPTTAEAASVTISSVNSQMNAVVTSFNSATGLAVTVTGDVSVVDETPTMSPAFMPPSSPPPSVLPSPTSSSALLDGTALIGITVGLALGTMLLCLIALQFPLVQRLLPKAVKDRLFPHQLRLKDHRKISDANFGKVEMSDSQGVELGENLTRAEMRKTFFRQYSEKRIPWRKLTPVEHIGSGSFSVVIRAVWTERRRETSVAVKLYTNKTGASRALEDMLFGEFDVAYRAQQDSVNNTNTMKVHGVTDGEISDEWLNFLEARGLVADVAQSFDSLVARFEPGGSLRDLLHNPEKPCVLSLEQRLRILLEIANGLDRLHNCEGGIIVHGDLKPENILLNEQLQVRLIDFGIARFKEELMYTSYHESLPQIGYHGGTAAYMAPELDLDGLENSRTTDMYSFGTIVWEVLTCRQPWSQFKRPIARVNAIKSGETLNYSLMPANTPASVMQLVKDCLVYSPTESKQMRPRSGDALEIIRAAYETVKTMDADIFLSYSWGAPKPGSLLRRASSLVTGAEQAPEYTRQPLALQMYKELRELGYTVWMDIFDMGNDLKESMREGIRRSRCVVVLLSPEYIRSYNCRFELDFAVSEGKKIITCMACDPQEVWRPYGNPALPFHTLFKEVGEKLNIAGRMYCELQRAAAVDWTSKKIRSGERELLTHSETALVRLRKILEDEGICTAAPDISLASMSTKGGAMSMKVQQPMTTKMKVVLDMLEKGEAMSAELEFAGLNGTKTMNRSMTRSTASAAGMSVSDQSKSTLTSSTGTATTASVTLSGSSNSGGSNGNSSSGITTSKQSSSELTLAGSEYRSPETTETANTAETATELPDKSHQPSKWSLSTNSVDSGVTASTSSVTISSSTSSSNAGTGHLALIKSISTGSSTIGSSSLSTDDHDKLSPSNSVYTSMSKSLSLDEDSKSAVVSSVFKFKGMSSMSADDALSTASGRSKKDDVETVVRAPVLP